MINWDVGIWQRRDIASEYMSGGEWITPVELELDLGSVDHI
jgi:hypothetical protein